MLELSLEEQETSIYQMGDDRSTWGIVTSDNVWKARLQKMGFEPVREQGPTMWFSVPVECVLVRKKPAKRTLSPEHLAALRGGLASSAARDSSASEA